MYIKLPHKSVGKLQLRKKATCWHRTFRSHNVVKKHCVAFQNARTFHQLPIQFLLRPKAFLTFWTWCFHEGTSMISWYPCDICHNSWQHFKTALFCWFHLKALITTKSLWLFFPCITFLAVIYNDLRQFWSQSSVRSHADYQILLVILEGGGIQKFRPSGDLSSYVNNSHVLHAYIHNSVNHSLPLTVCMALTFFLCRKSAPKVSHSSCTRSSWPYRAASRTAVQPSWGKGAIVDCDTTNRRGESGVQHKAFRNSRYITKPQHLTLTINCICLGASRMQQPIAVSTRARSG